MSHRHKFHEHDVSETEFISIITQHSRKGATEMGLGDK